LAFLGDRPAESALQRFGEVFTPRPIEPSPAMIQPSYFVIQGMGWRNDESIIVLDINLNPRGSACGNSFSCLIMRHARQDVD